MSTGDYKGMFLHINIYTFTHDQRMNGSLRDEGNEGT
jgi:hypothetical protein